MQQEYYIIFSPTRQKEAAMSDAHMEAGVDLRDVDIRVIDQRIG